MTDPVPGNEATQARQAFSRFVADSRAQMARIAQMRASAEQVSVTETSADGAVTVTVNASGVLTDLLISDKAAGLPGARIAAAVLGTMRRAQARIAERMGEVMQATIGDDRQTMDRVMAVYHERFPEPQPEGQDQSAADTHMRFGSAESEWRPAPPPARQSRPARGQDEGWAGDDGPIMRRY